MSVDPITNQYPQLTPYQFASNRPIDGIDLDGLEYAPAGGIGDGMAMSIGEMFKSPKNQITMPQLLKWQETQAKGYAKGAALGLTTAASIYYGPMVLTSTARYFITNPQATVTATGFLWGALVDEDFPGEADDEARTARNLLGTAFKDDRKFVARMFKDGEGMSQKAWFKYQGQINGVSGKLAGAWEYLKNGVRFDGFKNGVLLEAKGFYQQLFKSGATTRDVKFGEMLNQLRNQIRAADGAKLEWHFAEQSTLDEFKGFLNKAGAGDLLKSVDMKHTEFKPEKF